MAREVRPDAGRPLARRRKPAGSGKSVRGPRVKKAPPAPHVDQAIRYAENVTAGTIPACQWVRLACARFLGDRERELGEDWPYRLDHAAAERVCRFAELMPHTKGKWAQRRETIRLEDWQAFVLVNVFGWLRKRDGLRRFRTALIVVPRKNGKSALSAPVGLYMLAADGEYGAEVYCGATSEKQAWEVFRPASEMAKRTPALRAHFGVAVNASNINILANSSRFEPIIGKPGDGSSPSCAIVDEYHEHPSSELWDTMLTGMGAREQPLMWGITTAGDNIAGPCYNQIQTSRKVLQGIFDDDTLFYIEWTIDDGDDWTSPDALRKANPNMGVSVSEEFLLDRQRDSIRDPYLQATFKTKHLNVWVNSRSAYFNMTSWGRCQDAQFSESALHGKRAIIGLDLASKQDIAALQVLVPLDGGRLATFGRYYLPEAALKGTNVDHYRGWADALEPSLTVTEGDVLDHQRIMDDLELLRRQFMIDEIVFDPAQAAIVMSMLMERGANVIEFQQNARNFSEPMKQVKAEMDAGLLIHNSAPNAPMTWMISNVEARTDAKDQVYPRKPDARSKIDGPVALIMARARLLLSAGPSPYESRGLLIL